MCVLLLYFSTMWPIWEIDNDSAHPNDISGLHFRGKNVYYDHWNIFGKSHMSTDECNYVSKGPQMAVANP